MMTERIAFDRPVVGEVTLSQVVKRIPAKARRTGSSVEARYVEGVKYAGELDYVTIALNNVWGGKAGHNGRVDSYERVGYHTGGDDFILGLLAGGCPVYCAWDGDSGLEWKRVVL